MGGNALKHCTGRFSRQTYDLAVNLVLRELGFLFPGIRMEDIQFFRNKQEFGDIDILIQSEGLPVDWLDQIIKTLNPVDHHKNGNVFSFEFEGIQVDLIRTKKIDFDIAATYFANNDAGNLIGRIAHKFGLKYGHSGLWYPFRDGDHLVDTIFITRDPEKIFSLLGYDYSRWMEGFDDLDEIFEFTASSPFYNPEIYLLENRNNIARVRDRKRKSYTAFLQWCKVRHKADSEYYQFSPGKDSYLPYIWDNFPEFLEKWKETDTENEIRKAVKEKFNGDIVMGITGRSGKDLGALMQAFRKSSGENFDSWVISAPAEEIETSILEFYKEWEDSK